MMELEDRIVRFAARCVKVCAALPVKAIGSASFADQLFRSSTSIAANYAEACPLFNLYELAPGFLLSLVVTMIVSLATKKPSDAIRAEYDSVAKQLKMD